MISCVYVCLKWFNRCFSVKTTKIDHLKWHGQLQQHRTDCLCVPYAVCCVPCVHMSFQLNFCHERACDTKKNLLKTHKNHYLCPTIRSNELIPLWRLSRLSCFDSWYSSWSFESISHLICLLLKINWGNSCRTKFYEYFFAFFLCSVIVCLFWLAMAAYVSLHSLLHFSSLLLLSLLLINGRGLRKRISSNQR